MDIKMIFEAIRKGSERRQAELADAEKDMAQSLIATAWNYARIPSKYKYARWENTVITEHNKSVVEYLRQWADGMPYSDRLKPPYIYGGVGTGKTWLACAALNEIIVSGKLILKLIGSKTAYVGNWETLHVRYLSVPDYLQHSREGNNDDDIAEARSAVVLVLDDIGIGSTTDWAIERLYALVNHRYAQNMPTLITSNLPLSELAGLIGMQIPSRIAEMCKPMRLEGGDWRVKTKGGQRK